MLLPDLVVRDLAVLDCAPIDLVVTDLVVYLFALVLITLEINRSMRAETVHAWWVKPPGLMHMTISKDTRNVVTFCFLVNLQCMTYSPMCTLIAVNDLNMYISDLSVIFTVTHMFKLPSQHIERAFM